MSPAARSRNGCRPSQGAFPGQFIDMSDTVRSGTPGPTRRVLCVDLDGTLVATDMLWESVFSALRRRPISLFLIPFWLLRGRPVLKWRLADLADIDYKTLPYRQETIALITEARRRGSDVVLATASALPHARGVAEHLRLFSGVLASDGDVNLKGQAKAEALIRRFGAKNFDYVGDSLADIPCWESAADAVTVGAFPVQRVRHLRHLAGSGPPEFVARLRSFLRALRPHQWLKNLLIFVPLLGAHQLDISTITMAFIAFASLSFSASGGYVLNDLLDLAADRAHWRKKYRPFAAGHLSIRMGALIIAGLWTAGFVLARTLPWQFFASVAAYLVGTAAYSLALKREPVLDVLFLAGLYVLRVLAGGWATQIPVSSWLLAFTLFLCLSLAFLKRFIEVRAQSPGSGSVVGRGYFPEDAGLLQAAGLASAYLSVLVLALYVSNPEVTRLYEKPERLLLICPLLLYGTTKVWLRAHRRELHDDPLVAVVADPGTYVILAFATAVVVLSV